MKELSPTWITDDYIDFELKKYKLLAYLKYVEGEFKDYKLYPHLGDLISHLSTLESLKEKKTIISNHFPKELTSIDVLQFNLEYKALINQSEHMDELDKILKYSIPEINKYIQKGAKIYDEVEQTMDMLSIGLIPTYSKTGYFILDTDKLLLYKYEVGDLMIDEAYKSIKVDHVKDYEKTMENTYEKIRLDIIQNINKILDNPNPPTYVLKVQNKYDIGQTIIPLAKRMLLIKNINI
tara:strand:- start:17 stop:727 length:711 start_codon:yes stop_codon:yes gene_type:complete